MRNKIIAALLLSISVQASAFNDDTIETFAKKALLNAYKDKLLEKYDALQKCTDVVFCYLPTRLAVEKLKREIGKIQEESE